MTTDILTNIGEEYYTETALNGVSLTVGLYNDSTDQITDSSDVGSITTEPSNTNYARVTTTYSLTNVNNNWGIHNDNKMTFDFSDQSTSENVDAAFIVANFQSDETGDGSANDHLIANSALSQQRDIGNVNSLTVAAGDAEITIE